MEPNLVNDKVRVYLDSAYARTTDEDVKAREIIRHLQEIAGGNEIRMFADRAVISSILWDESFTSISDVFKGDRASMLEVLFGTEKAEAFRAIWDRRALYPYSSGLDRRPYRIPSDSRAYLYDNIWLFQEFVFLTSIGFELPKYLSEQQEESIVTEILPYYIAYELDNGNQEILHGVRGALSRDSVLSSVIRDSVRGALCSRNAEAHMIVSDLLDAAKLQEGLRQLIFESADYCSLEGFCFILKVILEKKLVRFASVIRAFDTWTGMGFTAEDKDIVEECIRIAYEALEASCAVEKLITSENNLEVFLGLWSIAVKDVSKVAGYLDYLLRAKEKYKRIIALLFLKNCQISTLQHTFAARSLCDDDLEVAVLAASLVLPLNRLGYGRYSIPDESFYRHIGGEYKGKKLFDLLSSLLPRMKGRQLQYSGSVFPWVEFSSSQTDVLRLMVVSAILEPSDEALSLLEDNIGKIDPQSKLVMIEHLLKDTSKSRNREMLIGLCGDKSSVVRREAFSIVDGLDLEQSDFLFLENCLSSKNEGIRRNAIRLVMKQSPEGILSMVNRLASDKDKGKKIALAEILRISSNRPEGNNKGEECAENKGNSVALEMDAAPAEMSTSLPRVKPLTLREDFNFFRNGEGMLLEMPDKNKKQDQSCIIDFDPEEVRSIIREFSELIKANENIQYESDHRSDVETVVLGASTTLLPYSKRRWDLLDSYPLSAEVRDTASRLSLNLEMILKMEFYMGAGPDYANSGHHQWFTQKVIKPLNLDKYQRYEAEYSKIPHYRLICRYISLLAHEQDKAGVFHFSNSVLRELFWSLSESEHKSNCATQSGIIIWQERGQPSYDYCFSHWLWKLVDSYKAAGSFRDFFVLYWALYRVSGYSEGYRFEVSYFEEALKTKLLSEAEFFEELFFRRRGRQLLRAITENQLREKDFQDKYPNIHRLIRRAIDAIIEIETHRGELNTEVTELIPMINYCSGVRNLAKILEAMDKGGFIRGYIYGYRDMSKVESMSHLLRTCYPEPNENGDTLRGIPEANELEVKRLVEASLYAPQWIEVITGFLNNRALKSACWYFLAHANRELSKLEASIIAQYSNIPAEDFKDGAFDRRWFHEVSTHLDKALFKIVYDSAKYVSGSNLHRRAQLFADAVQGKLELSKAKGTVAQKRNRDYLLAYSLVPIVNQEDLLQRYEFIQRFKAESKAFGMLRRTNEERCTEVAIRNLADNAGYDDVNRFIWNMEAEKFVAMRAFLELQDIEGVTAQIVIDGSGQVDLAYWKDGKQVSAPPVKVAGNERLKQLKAVAKEFKQLAVRGRKSFEEAMERRSEFGVQELGDLCRNSILEPIIRNLVFIGSEYCGYLRKGSIVDAAGTVHEIKPQDRLRIAHCHDLYRAGVWAGFQRDIFDRGIVQPFKQVFRELYQVNESEQLKKGLSYRYSGQQVQPKKALALLSSRNWIASHELGVQKVFYKDGIIAVVYSNFDWFTPAEAEAPVINTVSFHSRSDYSFIDLKDVPPVVFSEVMRDMDLVVSVAHASGVDPEASSSSIETRRAVVKEAARVLKLTNVSFDGNFSTIEGSLGRYLVHLGSATAQMMGFGSVIIVPVHSQQRGRVFLPFLDNDPKTAEVVSKVILLAEDRKIKDPFILAQIGR